MPKRAAKTIQSSKRHYIFLAGAEGLEPTTYGFGDRRSTN